MEPNPKKDCNADTGRGEGSNSRSPSRRWAPTDGQIRILQTFYENNGDIVLSPEQIHCLHEELLLHGSVEPKNVHYWYQNRRARDKQKKRSFAATTDAPTQGSPRRRASDHRIASPEEYRLASPSENRPTSLSEALPASPSGGRPASPSDYRSISPSEALLASPSEGRPASPSDYRSTSPSEALPASPSGGRPASPSDYRSTSPSEDATIFGGFVVPPPPVSVEDEFSPGFVGTVDERGSETEFLPMLSQPDPSFEHYLPDNVDNDELDSQRDPSPLSRMQDDSDAVEGLLELSLQPPFDPHKKM